MHPQQAGQPGPEPSSDPPHRVTITVLGTQLEALRARLGDDLTNDELYSAAAIAVLLYLEHNGPGGLAGALISAPNPRR